MAWTFPQNAVRKNPKGSGALDLKWKKKLRKAQEDIEPSREHLRTPNSKKV